MKDHWYRAFLALTTVLLSPNPIIEQEPILAPVTPLIAKLEQGIAEVIKGKEPIEAFRPWSVGEVDRVRALREALKTNSVSKAGNAGIELAISFVKEGKGIYVLKLFIWEIEKHVKLAMLKGEKQEWSGDDIEKLKEDSRCLGEMSRSLIAVLKGKNVEQVPFATEEEIKKLVGSKPVYEQILKQLNESKKAIVDTCAAVAGLEYDTVLVSTNDQSFVARKEDGTPCGVIRAKLRLDQGIFTYELREFRAFPK